MSTCFSQKTDQKESFSSLPKRFFSFLGFFLKMLIGVGGLYAVLSLACGLWGPFASLFTKQLIDLLPTIKDGQISPLFLPASLIVINFIVFDNITWRGIAYIRYKYLPFLLNRIDKALLSHVLQLGGWIFIFLSLSVYLSKETTVLSENQATQESILGGQTIDSLTHSLNVLLFAHKDHEINRREATLLTYQEAYQKREMNTLILHCVQGGLIILMMAFSTFFLIDLYGKNKVTIGDFSLILGLCMHTGHMMWFIMADIMTDFNKTMGRCKQSLDALILPLEIIDSPQALVLQCPKGGITFREVTFKYKGGTTLFHKKCIEILPGQKVGLVGYSGGGKSTFVHLILRLYDVIEGSILIDGQNIQQVTQESLRKKITMIPQDPSLFHRSLMENIRYGRLEATDEEVIMAAKKAYAHEFIQDLPEGYQSLVGERGVKLSGGQRQRISIARAFLKNAPLLILDEATSQLDSITEHQIQNSLWDLMHQKTTLIIAHRLSTLLHMDRILVFDQGKIVQDGAHDHLVSQEGLYQTLWNAQVSGFILDDQKTSVHC